MESERPENTCCGVSTPKRPNAIDAPNSRNSQWNKLCHKRKNAATAKNA